LYVLPQSPVEGAGRKKVANLIGQVFEWFINITTVSSLFNWLTLFLATIRFRKGYLAQGVTRTDLPFRSPLMPYAAYYGCGMVAFFIPISGFDVFFPEKWSVKNFFANVVSLPLNGVI